MVLRGFREGVDQLCIGVTQSAVVGENLVDPRTGRRIVHLLLTSSSPQALVGSTPNTRVGIFLDFFSTALLARIKSLPEYSLSSAILL